MKKLQIVCFTGLQERRQMPGETQVIPDGDAALLQDVVQFTSALIKLVLVMGTTGQVYVQLLKLRRAFLSR